MKRLLLILTSIFALVTTSWADQITRDQALAKAQQFLNQKGISRSLKVAETQMSRARARGKSTPDYYYVFNAGQNQGFVIVSGDDRAEEVLGYSEKGSFDIDNIPCNMAAWLQGYADQIKYIQDNNIQSSPKSRTTRSNAAISPMVTSKWDQSAPYNNECPSVGTTKCVTGCVTTAVSQLLYFHAKANGVNASSTDIPGYTTATKSLTMPALSATSFDWGNMIDEYNSSATDEQKAAVAKLFQYVGTGLEADYNTAENGGTSVWDNKPEIVFKNYFGYGSGIKLVRRRSLIPESEWDNLICNELANGRPVLYSGQSQGGGGHSFIIHGYDGAGKYNINWGWGGYQDNYFALSALNPDTGGAGAGSGGYNYDQTALVGISNSNVETYNISFEETPVLSSVGICIADPSVNLGGNSINSANYTEYIGTKDASGNINFSFRFSYGVNLYYDYAFNVGYVLLKDGVTVGNYGFNNNLNISGGEYSFSLSGKMNIGNGLANGDYQLKMIYKLQTVSDWNLCADADNYILNVRVTDTSITLKVGDLSPDPTPEVTDADRAELTNTYNTLKTSVEAKQTEVTTNETKINALKTAIEEKNTSIAAIEETISSISTKLTNDTYLSEAQKADFNTQLTTLTTQKVKLSTELISLQTSLTTFEAFISTLKAQINSLLSEISEQITAIASITTTAALDASKSKASQLKTKADGYDAASITTQVAASEASLNGITITNLQTDLSDLDKAVDKAIADAKAAAEEAEKEEAAKKLAKAKQDMQANIDALKTKLDAVNSEIQKSETNLKDLIETIKKGKETLDALKTKAEDIKKLLADNNTDRTRAGLTDEQHTAYQNQLDELNKTIEGLEKTLSALNEAKDGIEEKIKAAKTSAESLTSEIASLSSALETATDIETVEAMSANVSSITLKIDDISTATKTVNADITTQSTEAETFVKDSTSANAEAEKLSSSVKETITGIDGITIDENEIQGRYDLSGRPVDANYKGAMIIRMTNGKTIKIFKR